MLQSQWLAVSGVWIISRGIQFYLVDVNIEMEEFVGFTVSILDSEEVEGLVEGEVETVLAAHVQGRAFKVAVGRSCVHQFPWIMLTDASDLTI